MNNNSIAISTGISEKDYKLVECLANEICNNGQFLDKVVIKKAPIVSMSKVQFELKSKRLMDYLLTICKTHVSVESGFQLSLKNKVFRVTTKLPNKQSLDAFIELLIYRSVPMEIIN